MDLVPFKYTLSGIDRKMNEKIYKREDLSSNLNINTCLTCQVSPFQKEKIELTIKSNINVNINCIDCSVCEWKSRYILDIIHTPGRMYEMIGKSILTELIHQHLSQIPDPIRIEGRYRVPNLIEIFKFVTQHKEDLFKI